MKSETITVKDFNLDLTRVLDMAEQVARYESLSSKESLHLRLLTEELGGLVRAITGEKAATFWIEAENKQVELHLSTQTDMTYEKRQQLLSTATSGKNEAAKGVIGKIRDLFSRMMEDYREEGIPPYISNGLIMDPNSMASVELGYAMEPELIEWSLGKYKDSLEARKEQGENVEEEWDELEKSVITKLADEVRVDIRFDSLEVIIYKKFLGE